MKRFVKIMVLAFGFMGSCAAVEFSEQERWEFFQQKFVENPGKTWQYSAARNSELLSWATAFCIAFPAAGLNFVLIDAIGKSFDEIVGLNDLLHCVKTIICMLGIPVLAKSGVSGLIKCFKSNVDCAVLKEYLEHYEEYRDKTPVVIQAKLDVIYSEYKTSADREGYLNEVVRSFVEAIVKLSSGYTQFQTQQITIVKR
jgi:hypothetical protein